MLFQYCYLASLAPFSFSCISSVWFRYSSSAHQDVQPVRTLFINRNRNRYLQYCAVQDKLSPLQCAHTVFTMDGPLPHSVDVSLGLCFNSGSALFQFNSSLPVLCKKQGVKSQPSKFHSHGPHSQLSTLSFTTRQLPLRPPESNMGDTATRQH